MPRAQEVEDRERGELISELTNFLQNHKDQVALSKEESSNFEQMIDRAIILFGSGFDHHLSEICQRAGIQKESEIFVLSQVSPYAWREDGRCYYFSMDQHSGVGSRRDLDRLKNVVLLSLISGAGKKKPTKDFLMLLEKNNACPIDYSLLLKALKEIKYEVCGPRKKPGLMRQNMYWKRPKWSLANRNANIEKLGTLSFLSCSGEV